ncbi:MAG: pilin [bacterium]|nr:pilin [bacterium]
MSRFLTLLLAGGAILAVTAAAFVPITAQAALCPATEAGQPARETGPILPVCVCTGDCGADDFAVMFINLAQFFVGIAALIAMYYLVLGGFTLVVSGGSSEKIQAGKGMVVNALVGMFVVFASWVIINTVYYAFATSDEIFGSKWWELKRADPHPADSISSQCDNLENVAEEFGALFPAANDPQLNLLITCIRDNVPSGWIDSSQIYTTDRKHGSCNYTRGKPVCDSVCSHSVNSCHYGGAAGPTGAMAVDFNAASTTEQELFNAVKAALIGPCSGLGNAPLFETNHTHVSIPSCGGL